MTRLQWQTVRALEWKGISIPCSESLQLEVHRGTGLGQHAGIRPSAGAMLAVKRLLAPARRVFNHAFSTGFLHRGVGRWIRRYVTPHTVFLEIGCGSMELRRYLPRGCPYNAIDLAISEHQILHTLARDRTINFALAVATDIPLPDDSVDVVAATEVFEHIPRIDDAMRDIRRVLRPGGKVLCSIPNNYYHKYQVIGENEDHVNKWTFDGFAEYMAGFGFRVLERYRVGYWIPIGRKRFDVFYLPITPKDEYYTSNFLYAFELQKDASGEAPDPAASAGS